MREIDKYKGVQIGMRHALIAHEAGVRYRAWKKGLLKPVTYGQALLKYHSFACKIIREFQKEGKI